MNVENNNIFFLQMENSCLLALLQDENPDYLFAQI